MMELNFKTNDIAFEVKEHVAYILLNKPEQYNPIFSRGHAGLVPVPDLLRGA